MKRLDILGLKVSYISFRNAIEQVKNLGFNLVPSYVCFANSHMTIEAHNDKYFAKQVNNATLVLTDGMPVAIACFLLHNKKQERIAGMEFMPRLLSDINNMAAQQPRIFFYGSTQKVLDAVTNTVRENYENIKIAGVISPPFRPLKEYELEEFIGAINNAHPHFVFVGIGCPKQEKWMAENFKKINAVLIGVGGAFLTASGLQKRAPQWMQNISLEWLYRLLQEPQRLFKRYFITNTLFIFLLIKTLAKKLFYGRA